MRIMSRVCGGAAHLLALLAVERDFKLPDDLACAIGSIKARTCVCLWWGSELEGGGKEGVAHREERQWAH